MEIYHNSYNVIRYLISEVINTTATYVIPSREKKVPGLNYQAEGYDEAIAANKVDNNVSVKMYGMVGGKYTQVEVTYRGKPFVLVLNRDMPSNDPNDIIEAVLAFYAFVDLGQTALLKKASSPASSPKVEIKAKVKSANAKKKGIKYNTRTLDYELGLTPIDKDANKKIIYKEQIIQIFAYARKRLTDESIPTGERDTFASGDVIDIVFSKDKYAGRSDGVRQTKTSATLKYMFDQGWLERAGYRSRNVILYRVVANPFEAEMPAQAEFDPAVAREQKDRELEMYRKA